MPGKPACGTTGVYITVLLGSVFRAVLTVSRTLLVWALNLGLHYSGWGDGQLGEPWDPRALPLQLAGFLLGIAGTVIYAQGSTR